jgi:uncharacterized protein involved in exopolysaccharide biosynthesis
LDNEQVFPSELKILMNPAVPARSEPRVGLKPEEDGENAPAVLYWFNLLLGHRRGLLLGGVVGALLAVGLKLLQPPLYTAEALAVMDSQQQSSQLSGITAQLGLGPLQGDGSPTPYFYADLMTSELVLGSTVDSTYTYRANGKQIQGNLISILGISGGSVALKRDRAVGRVRKMVSARVTPKTGVITISATAPDAQLAAQIVARIIAEVNRVNILSRQNQAGGERAFTGTRVVEAGQELRAAENELEDFLQHNRDYRSAPRTAIEEDRLARTVAMRQAIYTSVSQAYEQAKIDEARDTPGIRVVAPATVPALPTSRGLTQIGLLGMFIGLLAAICIGLWKVYLEDTAERDPEQVMLFRRTLYESLGDLTHPWRFFRNRSA